MQFAIYYIPPEGDFYSLGSSLVGYDIRKRKTCELPWWFEHQWNDHSQKYGFHLTITDVVELDEKEIINIDNRISDILSCFSLKNTLQLKAKKNLISFWDRSKSTCVLRLIPNQLLLTLHCVLVSMIQTVGTSSGYYKDLLLNNGDSNINMIEMDHKIKLFLSPYILDEFKPHFTLINPYFGDNQAEITYKLKNMFSYIKQLQVNSLCLVARENSNDYFEIYKEYSFE
jgi:hypothetical protein